MSEKEGNASDVLPLLFIEKLKADKIKEYSLENEDNNKSWKQFLDGLPESQNEVILKLDDRYWRWKMYKKYVPEERTFFGKTMSCGPKLDHFGRLPISGEELKTYRVTQAIVPKHEISGKFLKKGDGLTKLAKRKK